MHIAFPHARLLDTAGVTVVDAWLEKMTMLEQLQLVQKSCIMIGAHGYGPASLVCRLCACVSHGPSSCVFLMYRAGVSHVLFARPGTQLIEIRIPQYRRPHFISYSKIAGVGWIDMTPSGLLVFECPFLGRLPALLISNMNVMFRRKLRVSKQRDCNGGAGVSKSCPSVGWTKYSSNNECICSVGRAT
jgi:hypothetical protein